MRILLIVFILVLNMGAWAAPKFPILTGRIVDEANILSASTINSLDQILADYERGTSNQVVVVTLHSLQGTSIEDYGYQLGRSWKIGQKDKDNGILFIIVPDEKKVRIEVGYGLEPILTDAVTSIIIHRIVLPQFRVNQIEKGIIEGTQAILDVLGGRGLSIASSPEELSSAQKLFVLLFMFGFIWFAARHPILAAVLLSNASSRFGGAGRSGRFGGGGGSFGGGGASGSW